MGSVLDKPVTDKTTEQGESASSGVKYGASAMQGYRVDMEDEHTCIENVPGLPGHAYFAVYGKGFSIFPCLAGAWAVCTRWGEARG